jgi:hypothetical protein
MLSLMKAEISIAITEKINGQGSLADSNLEVKECSGVSISARVDNPSVYR